jgi:dephospho-CoA kinase
MPYTEFMSRWKYNRSKPVIGLAGGIGSGKSTVARLFASEGCAVIDSDALAHEALQSPEVGAVLRDWLGDAAFHSDGRVNRKAVGGLVFGNPENIARLNGLIHPRVAALRDGLMKTYLDDSAVLAIVWDSPLLVETGLHADCDAVVFINVPREIRLQRVREKRGWTAEELERREKLQFPLDKKAQVADYCLDNSGDEASSLRQVQRVLSQLSAKNAS